MAKILQHNLGKLTDGLHCLLETSKERGVDLMLIQEPPNSDCRPTHTACDLWSVGRTLAARRVDSDWTVTTEGAHTGATEGDVQVLAVGRRGQVGRHLRVVNVYFQRHGREGSYRPAERARWDDILTDEAVVIARDCNAHSPVWNPWCTTRRDARSLEDLI